MESQEIFSRLQPIFRDIFDDPSISVERTSSADTIEGWDSMAHLNLIMSVEEEFGVKFALGELQSLKNVGEMVDLMQAKLNRTK